LTDARPPLRVAAPVAGRVMEMASVPDPVFAQGLVGPGAAIDPERGPMTAVSPINGTLLKVHPHAFVVASADGRGVLVHLGIDTVQMRGEGFTLHRAEGAVVKSGEPIVGWDSAAVEASGRSPIVPVVCLEAAEDAAADIADGAVAAGEALLTWS
jgi:sugar PTS system EIIA component